RKVGGSRPQTNAMEFVLVEHRGTVGRFMSHPVVLPTESGAKSERRRDLPFVLEVGHVKSTAQPVATPGRNELDAGKRGTYQSRIVAKGQRVVCGLSLIEPDAANLHAGLEIVAAMSPS